MSNSKSLNMTQCPVPLVIKHCVACGFHSHWGCQPQKDLPKKKQLVQPIQRPPPHTSHPRPSQRSPIPHPSHPSLRSPIPALPLEAWGEGGGHHGRGRLLPLSLCGSTGGGQTSAGRPRSPARVGGGGESEQAMAQVKGHRISEGFGGRVLG